jgi:hypothetical protein
VIREAAGKVLDGGSLRAICRDLNDRGVPSPRAARGYKAPPARYSKGGWQIANMRAMLLRPLTAGLISFDEDWKQDGRRRARPSWQSPVVGKGNWEPILSTETSERLKAVLTSPARRTSKPGPYYRWLLSGIARCGVCGSRNLRVGTQHRSGRRHYVCEDGAHVARVADDVDALVEIAVIKRLSHPGFAASLNPPVDVAALDARRDVLSAELDAFARQPGITPSQLAIVSEPKLAELKQISEKITAAYGGSAFDGIAGAADPAAAFKNAGIARQRQLVDALFTVTILPVSHDGPLSAAERQRRYRARRKAGGPPVKRGPAFRPDSVRIEPRDDIAQRSVT